MITDRPEKKGETKEAVTPKPFDPEKPWGEFDHMRVRVTGHMTRLCERIGELIRENEELRVKLNEERLQLLSLTKERFVSDQILPAGEATAL